MPTTPPNQTTAANRNRSPGGSSTSWRWGTWLPLGPAVAGVALSLGFHVTLRLWEQTKSYEPLDLSPPFAAKPLPGTSLDNLIRRHGSQLPLLLNPATQPDRFTPPPSLPDPNPVAEGTLQLRDANSATPAAPAVSPATPDNRQDRPSQDRIPLALPRPAPPTPVEPGAAEPLTLPPPAFEAPEVPPPPAVDFEF